MAVSHSNNGLRFVPETFESLSSNPLHSIEYIYQYFSDGIDLISTSGNDTWRPVYIGGTKVLDSAITTGSLTFASASDSNHNVVFSYDSSILKANVDLSGISGSNYYHTPNYSTGLNIGSGHGISDLYVPSATATQYGAVKLFSATTQTVSAQAVTSATDRTYGVQKDSNGSLVVNVPWSGTSIPIVDISAL